MTTSSHGRPAVAARALAAMLGVSSLLLGLGACGEPPATSEPSDEGISGVQTYGDLNRAHTEDPVEYPQSPPVGGDHSPEWLDCTGTVYPEPVPNENAVHSLEHGAVWVTYDESLAEADAAALAERVDGEPYTFMSPYPEQSSPVMLTAWGVQLGLDGVDDSRVEEFLTSYREGPQTPEPGATCESGVMP